MFYCKEMETETKEEIKNSGPKNKNYVPCGSKKVEEIKKIWLEYKDKLTDDEIYGTYLAEEYYGTIHGDKETYHLGYLNYLNHLRVFKKEIENEQLNKEFENADEATLIEKQNENRKKIIFMLGKVLAKYEHNPSFFRNLGMKEVTYLYSMVQKSEEAIAKTEIERGKLKLHAIQTLLPYSRLSLDELKTLQDNFNNGITQLIQLKSGGKSGSDTTGVGGTES